jgi:hypothetical protein
MVNSQHHVSAADKIKWAIQYDLAAAGCQDSRILTTTEALISCQDCLALPSEELSTIVLRWDEFKGGSDD